MLMFQGKDPSVFLDGIRASARDPLSFSRRAKPKTCGNPFGHGLSLCRRSTSYSTCLAFLPSACLCSFLCLYLCPSLRLCLCHSLLFAFAFRERRCGLVPVCHVPLSVRLVHRFPFNSESIVHLQACRVQSDVPAPFWIFLGPTRRMIVMQETVCGSLEEASPSMCSKNQSEAYVRQQGFLPCVTRRQGLRAVKQ